MRQSIKAATVTFLVLAFGIGVTVGGYSSRSAAWIWFAAAAISGLISIICSDFVWRQTSMPALWR
jgi:membrane protein YdbS with pleckstrin-like domain